MGSQEETVVFERDEGFMRLSRVNVDA